MPFIPILQVWNCVATVGNAFFGALPFGSALFYLRSKIMFREEKLFNALKNDLIDDSLIERTILDRIIDVITVFRSSNGEVIIDDSSLKQLLEIRKETLNKLEKAKDDLFRAEEKLAKSLNSEQYELYRDYCSKKYLVNKYTNLTHIKL